MGEMMFGYSITRSARPGRRAPSPLQLRPFTLATTCAAVALLGAWLAALIIPAAPVHTSATTGMAIGAPLRAPEAATTLPDGCTAVDTTMTRCTVASAPAGTLGTYTGTDRLTVVGTDSNRAAIGTADDGDPIIGYEITNPDPAAATVTPSVDGSTITWVIDASGAADHQTDLVLTWVAADVAPEHIEAVPTPTPTPTPTTTPTVVAPDPPTSPSAPAPPTTVVGLDPPMAPSAPIPPEVMPSPSLPPVTSQPEVPPVPPGGASTAKKAPTTTAPTTSTTRAPAPVACN